MGRRRRAPAFEPARYYARHHGLISTGFHDKRVVAVGLNGGSPMQVALARLGPGSLTLIDPEPVEVENLARSVYDASDVGRWKAEALAEHMAAANPFVAVAPVVADITRLPPAAVQRVAEADLILDCTDSFAASAHVNRLSLMFGVPAIFAGLFAGATGGRIIWQIPGQTACYRCLEEKRYQTAKNEGLAATALDGGSATIADIGFLDAIVLRLAVAILERAETSPFGGFFRALGKRQDIFVRLHPQFAFPDGTNLFDVALADLPTEPRNYGAELKAQAFFACDSLWLAAERNPDCPDCSHLQPREERAR